MSLIARVAAEIPAANATDAVKKTCAETLLARLKTLGVEVETSSNTSTSIAYAANGLTLRQRETVSITEYRGLTKDAAKALEALDTDTTTSTVYYRQIGTSGEYAAVKITTGTRTDYTPSRADEGDAWICVKKVTAFAAAEDDDWTTTAPTAATSTGIVVSYDYSSTKTFSMNGTPIFSNVATTVREYRYLSKDAAMRKVADETSDTVAPTTYYYPIYYSVQNYGLTETQVTNAYAYIPTGTKKSATARYVDAENGYTVSVTEAVYSAGLTDPWRNTAYTNA